MSIKTNVKPPWNKKSRKIKWNETSLKTFLNHLWLFWLVLLIDWLIVGSTWTWWLCWIQWVYEQRDQQPEEQTQVGQARGHYTFILVQLLVTRFRFSFGQNHVFILISYIISYVYFEYNFLLMKLAYWFHLKLWFQLYKTLWIVS